jgi:hypothetical protein
MGTDCEFFLMLCPDKALLGGFYCRENFFDKEKLFNPVTGAIFIYFII